jgi:rhamnogalacturonan endolyase
MDWVKKVSLGVCGGVLLGGLVGESFAATPQMERLGRGLTVANNGTGTFVSWRLLGSDEPTATFTLLRDGVEIAKISGSDPTSYVDASGSVSSVYTLKDEKGKVSSTVITLPEYYKDNYGHAAWKQVQLDPPADGVTPANESYSYTPNDMSVGDLDGDGEYELIVKWDPSNSKDNSAAKTGNYTGNVFIDAYKIDGTKLWRIDLGRNIRAGAHYTQYLVYDFDGDGIAEIAMKTSDATVDGTGKVIGDANANYRTTSGTIMSGNEYLTVFNGKTGAAITTIDYLPGRGLISGDSYGNRDNRMLAAVAYLDGVHPSMIFCRGYYTEVYIAAFDFDGKNLSLRWYSENPTAGVGLYGQGNHNLSVADLDGDGFDELVYGSAALNHDGTLLYRTGFGHGDAMHVSDMDPDREGLETYDVHEDGLAATYTEELRDKDGNVIWGTLQATYGDGKGVDNGRGLAADIDSTNRGFEMWSGTSGGIRTVKGELLSETKPSVNFRVYFSGDLQDELLDATGGGGSGGKIEKWNSTTKSVDRFLNLYGINNTTLNNYTKANPCLSADIFGDWREEIITRSSTDPSVVNIIVSNYTTPYRVYTLMHDLQYRESIAWQNVGYNQPPHLSYYLPDHVGENLKKPDISYVTNLDEAPASIEFVKVFEASTPDTASVGYVESDHAGFLGSAYWNFENVAGSFTSYYLTSKSDTTATLAFVYANGGTSDRKMVVTMGENSYTVSFPSTGWDTWDTALVTVAVPQGDFTLTLSSATTDGGPNICVFAFDISTIGKMGEDLNGSEDTTALQKSVVSRSNFYNPILEILNTNEAGMAHLEIFNMQGKRIRSISANVHVGENAVSLHKELLPAGVYMVKASVNSRPVAVKKFAVNP